MKIVSTGLERTSALQLVTGDHDSDKETLLLYTYMQVVCLLTAVQLAVVALHFDADAYCVSMVTHITHKNIPPFTSAYSHIHVCFIGQTTWN